MPRMAVAMVSSSVRSSSTWSAGSSWRAIRSRTPAGVSGPSPHRLATLFVIVFARRCPAVSHWLAGVPDAAPETIRPCFCRAGSRAAAAWSASAWAPAASSAHSPSVMPNRDSTTRCGKVVDHVDGAAPGSPVHRQPGTVPVTWAGRLHQRNLHRLQRPTVPGRSQAINSADQQARCGEAHRRRHDRPDRPGDPATAPTYCRSDRAA